MKWLAVKYATKIPKIEVEMLDVGSLDVSGSCTPFFADGRFLDAGPDKVQLMCFLARLHATANSTLAIETAWIGVERSQRGQPSAGGARVTRRPTRGPPKIAGNRAVREVG